jgi:hypothetical protein
MAFECTRYTIVQGADCDTDHYLVVAKFMGRMVVNKQAARKFGVERFNLRKLRELEFRNQYQLEITAYMSRLSRYSRFDHPSNIW